MTIPGTFAIFMISAMGMVLLRLLGSDGGSFAFSVLMTAALSRVLYLIIFTDLPVRG